MLESGAVMTDGDCQSHWKRSIRVAQALWQGTARLLELGLLLDQERRLRDAPFLFEIENEACPVPVLDDVTHVRREFGIVLAHAHPPGLGVDRWQHHRIVGPLGIAHDAGKESRVEYHPD